MSGERTQADREFDWQTGRELERKDAEIMWLRSSLVSLWTLAAAENSPLTLDQVVVICKHTLEKYPIQQKPTKSAALFGQRICKTLFELSHSR